MTTLINIRKEIDKYIDECSKRISEIHFSTKDMKKAVTLNKAYRIYLRSESKEVKEMFEMMLSILGYTRVWKDLCDIQQKEELKEVLKKAEELNGSVACDEETETYYIVYDNNKVIFNLNSTIPSEISYNSEFPEEIESLLNGEAEEKEEANKYWKEFQEKADKHMEEKEGMWYTANDWKKGVHDRTYIKLHTEGSKYEKPAGYLDNKTGNYIVGDKDVNILEF